MPELLLPGADDVLGAEVDAADDDELALLSRDVVMLDLGFPVLAPAPVLKENIGWPRSTSRLDDDDGPPSSTEDDEE